MAAGSLCLGIGIPIYQACGKHVPSARTTLLLLSEVVLAPLWTFAIVSELPTARTIGGGLVLLLAIVWLTLRPVPAREEDPPRNENISRAIDPHKGGAPGGVMFESCADRSDTFSAENI
jgi:drug/metabolite transporter (DMT)-like permease